MGRRREEHDVVGPDVWRNDPDSRVKAELPRQMGLLHCVAIIVGVVIGAGIFVSPVGILLHVQSAGVACAVWGACGIFSTLCALCFAELGASIPHSGGEYTYIRHGLGEVPAFLCLWVNLVLVCPGALAIAAQVLALYTLRPAFPDCPPPLPAVRLLAWLSTALLVTLNAIDTRWATRTQVVTTVGKLAAILLIIALGIYSLASGSVENFTEAFHNSDVSAGSLVLAFYAGFWSYGGWNYLTFVTDEVVNPRRNVPLALVLSLMAVTLVYLVTNLAYLAVLSPALMVRSSAVAVTFMQHVLPPLSFAMPIFIALSVFGNINGTCLTYSRLFFVGAQNSHLPTIISLIRLRGSTPVVSLITMLLLSGALLAYKDVFQLMEMMGFSFLLNLNMALLSLLHLRWSQPRLPRPVKVPVALPVALVAVVLGLQAITLYQKPADCAIALLVIALGLPLYWLGVVWSKPRSFNHAIAQVTVWTQKILLAVPADPVERSE